MSPRLKAPGKFHDRCIAGVCCAVALVLGRLDQLPIGLDDGTVAAKEDAKASEESKTYYNAWFRWW